MAATPEDSVQAEDQRYLISDLCSKLERYLQPEQVRDIYRAYLFGAEAHEGQHRLSGEPYIYHPIAVARILAEMRMDANSIMAAILHDVIEDTSTAKEQLERLFGAEVAELVDGVSKLTQIHFESKAEAQAENFRKMMLAMVKDIRVILIKLADRLHNMRTLGAMRPDKRRRIARETLEIYAPIANRLGMNSMRLELEDLGFAALYPMRSRVLAEAVKRARGNRREILSKIETAIMRRLVQEQIEGQVRSREKHLYSLYLKMKTKGLSFSEVSDVYAFRIIVDKADTCYRVLGIMHNLYKPVPGKFKDYIAIPKSNGYQSLHTVLFGPYGVPIEVQIRTEDMDRVAEAGIAAHWLYKTGDGGNGAQARAREWLRELLEMQKSAGDSLEFLENVKIDLFPDEVYVFTPKGEIMELPRGATAVDFAYAVHTEVGNSCIAAKIDRRLAPLRTPLLNGQTVEIITAPGAHPNPAWLNFVVTGKARANIRHHLKNLRHEEAGKLGRRLLEKALASFGFSLDSLPAGRVDAFVEECSLDSLEALLEDIGLGNRMPLLVARQLAGMAEEGESGATPRQPPVPLAIKGTEGMVVSFAKCCRPIPGDPIIGFVSAGRGIVIHSENCKNVADFRSQPEKWLDVEWEAEPQGEFAAELRVEVANQRGVLATVAAAIADLGSNIENVDIGERDGLNTTLVFTISVRDRRHLAAVMRKIRHIPQVMRVSRIKG
ncbi:bifunctional GTP diphosphokinase/guanosine-3',5'-bis pyrophosphate 3'-pyrophosphohydrolase [Thiohalobacter sp. IOR34]|uniref:bifunctional GTP diphosphokinase/guanosine-3',5'-bis pyrophosphate 3'-pyrophosphohydrolase n=1 Tax=Thiohalobacter sp. IOR34 TaxID=3057176 RepID=UPI0025B23149|nr:bifunctional GTP diphosphokinase/guanosine-3',5'-bis pyrophosphate 3'-pyrophosphohydrolase [Thiohalobacter sp. IOR34]WJW76789.1 bifunctional GTP diphosphokinase/guanosine-3',5'-bis pyrophosphate 3'-pyrophosphohydrolase [Thiohalobacter sp. IOR34]